MKEIWPEKWNFQQLVDFDVSLNSIEPKALANTPTPSYTQTMKAFIVIDFIVTDF